MLRARRRQRRRRSARAGPARPAPAGPPAAAHRVLSCPPDRSRTPGKRSRSSTGASPSGSPPPISPARRGSRATGSRSTAARWFRARPSRSSSRAASIRGSTAAGCGGSSTWGPEAAASRWPAPMCSRKRGSMRWTCRRTRLALARRNAVLHGVEDRVRLLRSDLFEGLEPEGAGRDAAARYDLIVSNPPYVTEEEMAGLPPECRAEPAAALAGGADGLDVVGRLIEGGAAMARPGRRPGGRDRRLARGAGRARSPLRPSVHVAGRGARRRGRLPAGRRRLPPPLTPARSRFGRSPPAIGR